MIDAKMAISREWQRLAPEIQTVVKENRDLPVPLAHLARALGVEIKAATLGVGKSGELRPLGNGQFVIKVNRHDPPVRQRFTVAHELAHFLLHRDQIGTGIEDDVLYRSALSDSREAEANRLAADILMPLNLVKDAAETAEAFGIEDVPAHLASLFQVSEAAMKIRLGLA